MNRFGASPCAVQRGVECVLRVGQAFDLLRERRAELVHPA